MEVQASRWILLTSVPPEHPQVIGSDPGSSRGWYRGDEEELENFLGRWRSSGFYRGDEEELENFLGQWRSSDF